MRRHLIGIIGLVLFLVGLIGVLVLSLLPLRVGQLGRFRSNGQRIYFTGAGRSGTIPRAGGAMMMSSGGCVSCHGPTGRGGRVSIMMGRVINIPDVRYLALTSPHKENGENIPGWTEAQIARAIREGIEPNGGKMNPYMPRWGMDDADMNGLIGYLKELR